MIRTRSGPRGGASHGRAVGLALLAFASGCARAPAPDAVATSTATPSATEMPSGASSSEAAAPSASAAESAGSVASAPALPTAAPAEAPPEALDYISRASILFRMAACGPSGEIPVRFDAAVVERHCADLSRASDEYKKTWVDVAKPFLGALRPKDLPEIVVYPFGGGDLVTALATFPDATEITTISLEPAGDVRTIDRLPEDHLAHELAVHRSHLERLFEKAHSRTDNLEKESKTELPGEIVFALAALVVHGDEPVGLRYFRLRDDGSVAYVTQDDLDAAAHHPNELRNLFQNVELRFRAAGGQGPVRVVRHIAFNLDDTHLKADGSLLAHLSAKGKVAAMTKAASHLLWNDHFSLIRGWLVDHTDWMISDSTGIPPRFAQAAGFVQDTYGTFDGPAPFGLYDKRDADDLKRLFKSEPIRDLPFRYGYPDEAGHAHLLVTRRDANVADANTKTAPASTP
jgi:hypothetical protein